MGIRRITNSIPDITLRRVSRNSPVHYLQHSPKHRNGRNGGSINRGIEFLRNAFFGYGGNGSNSYGGSNGGGAGTVPGVGGGSSSSNGGGIAGGSSNDSKDYRRLNSQQQFRYPSSSENDAFLITTGDLDHSSSGNFNQATYVRPDPSLPATRLAVQQERLVQQSNVPVNAAAAAVATDIIKRPQLRNGFIIQRDPHYGQSSSGGSSGNSPAAISLSSSPSPSLPPVSSSTPTAATTSQSTSLSSSVSPQMDNQQLQQHQQQQPINLNKEFELKSC